MTVQGAPADNFKEAYQSVIEFNKTIISITSTILAALISFLVFQDYSLSPLNVIAPIILIFSLIFSFFGFGYAMPAIRTNSSRPYAVVLSNAGGSFMLLGIIAIFLISKPEKATIDKALINIEKSLGVSQSVINTKNFYGMDTAKDSWIFHFKEETIKRKVTYSISKDQITSFEVEQ